MKKRCTAIARLSSRAFQRWTGVKKKTGKSFLGLGIILNALAGPTASQAASPLLNIKGADADSYANSFSSCTDTNDNLYLVGAFDGTVDFGGGNVTDPNTGLIGPSIFIAKYSSAGSLTWVKVIGSVKTAPSYGDFGRAIAVDRAGNVYAAGQFMAPPGGVMDVDPGPGTYNLNGTTGNMNSLLVKLDSSGNFVWAVGVTADTGSAAQDVCVDAAGQYVYLTGDTYDGGTLTDGPRNTTTLGTGADGKCLYVAKIAAANGGLAWARTAMNYGAGAPLAYGVAVDPAGNVLAVGGHYTLTFGSTVLASGGNHTDGYLWKLDGDGNHLWAKAITGTGYESIRKVVSDPSGNIFITGIFQNTADLDPGNATFNVTSVGQGDSFAARLNPSGDLQWAYVAGGTSTEIGSRLILDGGGSLYVCGTFQGTVDFDPTAGTDNATPLGLADVFVTKLSAANGSRAWTRTIGSSRADETAGVCLLSSGQLKVVAMVRNTADVDPSSGTLTASTSVDNKQGIAAVTWTGNGFLPSANTAPVFAGGVDKLWINQDSTGTDVGMVLHVKDVDAGQTLTWSQSSAPAHGTLSFSNATASSGSADIAPGGTITYKPAAGYVGTDSFTVQVSDGTATATRQIHLVVTDTIMLGVANGLVDFHDFGAKFTDGDGNTIDIPNISLEVLFADANHVPEGTVLFNTYTNYQYFDGVNGLLYASGINSGTAAQELVVQSSTGAEFNFKGIVLLNYFELDPALNTVAVTAYRNGTALGTVQVNVPNSGSYVLNLTRSNGLTAALFQNVDRVVLRPTADSQWPDGFNYPVNSIAVGEPVLPPNTAPTLQVNSGSTITEGGLDTISAAELSFQDAEQAAGAITYTVTTAPQHGELLLNGRALAASDTFSQTNLNNNSLQYAHDGSDTLSDGFGFSVSDGAAGVVSGQTFNFTVNPVTDRDALSTPATITFTRAPGGAVALDGSGGSMDVSGIALAVYFADASRNLVNSALTFEDPYAVGAVNSGLAVNYSSSAGSHYVLVKSRSAGDNFWLRALQLTDYGGNNLRIEGFNDGVSVGYTNVTVNTDPWYFTFDHNGVLLPAIFRNVDEVRIRGQDSGTIWLTINDITIAAPVSNQDPRDLALSKSSVVQSGGANAVVGTLTTTDADGGDSHTYTLVSGSGDTANAFFNIAGSTLRANNASPLAAGDYSVRIQTDDGQGGAYAEAFTVTVVDDIAPVITSADDASGTNGWPFSYTITATGQATAFGAQGLPAGLTVSTLTGEITGTPTQAGAFNLQITAADATGNTDTNALALVISKAGAVVTLANLNRIYDGTGKSASASTTPSGLTVHLTFNGAAVLPVNAGSYEVVGTISDANFSGSATNTLVVSKAPATVTLAGLSQVYDGTPKNVTASTIPSGLNVSLTYDGSASTPVNKGSYEVIGTISDANYEGSATNTLVIHLPTPAITLSVATNFYSLNGQPTRLDAQAAFSALGQETFVGAGLRVGIVSNLGPADVLTFHDRTSGTNRIQVSENDVRFDGTTIATYSGGATGAPSLQFAFTAGATQTGIQELLRNLSFLVGDKVATNFWRELEFRFTDSLGVEATPVSLVLGLNHLPRLGLDRAVTGTNLPVQIPFTRLLANDTDRDGDTLKVVGFETNRLQGGTLVVNETGFFYSPAPGFEGVDQFTYTVSDGKSRQAFATVAVIVLSESKLAMEDADTEPAALPNSSTVVFMGVPGRSYTVEASNDLIHWQAIGTVTPGESGLVKYYDADAVQHKHRFYRAVRQQRLE